MSQNLFVDFKGAALIRLMGTIVLMVLLLPSLSFAKNAFSDKSVHRVTETGPYGGTGPLPPQLIGECFIQPVVYDFLHQC